MHIELSTPLSFPRRQSSATHLPGATQQSTMEDNRDSGLPSRIVLCTFEVKDRPLTALGEEDAPPARNSITWPYTPA